MHQLLGVEIWSEQPSFIFNGLQLRTDNSVHVYSSHPAITVCHLFISMSLPPPKKEVMFLVRSDYSQTCERILMKFFGGVGHGSRTKWYNFGGDPDHASDPGVQSLKSESSGSAEVCALWAYLLVFFCHFLLPCVMSSFHFKIELWLL